MSDFDVVVVGSGGAGLAAALEASSAGARVLLVEASSVIGGSTRLSAGVVMAAGTRYQRAAGIEDTADALFEFYLTTNNWKVESSVVRRLAEESGPMVDWLGDLGVQFYPQIYQSGDEPQARGHVAAGEGQAIVDALHAEVRRRANIEIALGRRVNRLLVDDGKVSGVAVDDDEVRAESVVLTTGGFGANPELLDRYLPKIRELSGDFMWYVGTDHAQGDALALGESVDAQVLGHGRAQLTVRPGFGRGIEGYFPGWLVLVNAHGYRFYDEMAPYSVTQAIFEDEPHPIRAIFDDASKRAAQPSTTLAAKKVDIPGATWEDWIEPVFDEMITKGRITVADTIEELAKSLDIPPVQLQGTVDRYNRDVEAGADSQYLKQGSVMRPISTPPYYAAEVRLAQLAITGTGLRIDSDARVLNTSSAPVPGLFAAGECTGGVLGRVYLGSGNGLCSCLSIGRVAGRTAAAEARIHPSQDEVVR